MTSEQNKPDAAEPVQESKHLCGFYCLDSDGEVNCLKFCDETGALRQVPQGVCNNHACSEYVYTSFEEFEKTFDDDYCRYTESELCTVKGVKCCRCPHYFSSHRGAHKK